jgi:predicted nuclease of restriction endonuclease-like RecB superfamily
MLTGDLLRADVAGARIVPRFVDPGDAELLSLAGELVDEFRSHRGKSRGELRAALEGRARAGDRVRLERGLAKLLEDRSTFERSSTLDPEAARAQVFRRAAEARTRGDFSREGVLSAAASALGVATADEVEVALEADRKTRERLLAFDAPGARELLERYNVALGQAVLLRAVRVTIRIEARQRRLRDVLRAAKFRQLLFSARRDGKAVTLELDGPLSLFEASTKYGLNLASVLPAVLLCESFALEAELAWGPRRARRKRFVLTHEDGLVSPATDPGAAPPPELEAFARHFEKSAPGWRVETEASILWVGGEAIVPDLRFVHDATGRRAALELIAAARRGSLPGRLAILEKHAERGLVVAVSRELVEEGAVLPASVLLYKGMPSAEEVLARLT